MFDTHKNLASGSIQTPPSPALSGTSFTLQDGEGDLFEANMPVTICPNGVEPKFSNSEICYVTDVTGDTLTVLRAQEGTTARAIGTQWRVYGTATARTFQDIEEAVEAADKHYEQAFTGEATVTCNHNLGKFPAVTIIDTAGDEVEGEVNHVSSSSLTVTFSSAHSGVVYLN